MSFTTQTFTETMTTAVMISPTLFSDTTTTVISHLSTTLFATFGQTITIHSPSPASPSTTIVASPTTKYTPIPITTTQTKTITLTELDIYLQDDFGNIYSTWTIPISGSSLPNPTRTEDPGQLVYVVDPDDDAGWDHWSTGEKAGMIVGVVLGVILICGMIFWCIQKRRSGKWWFAHAWPHSATVAQPIDVGSPSLVHPTIVNGQVVPYQYGYGYGYGVGLGGGYGGRN